MSTWDPCVAFSRLSLVKSILPVMWTMFSLVIRHFFEVLMCESSGPYGNTGDVNTIDSKYRIIRLLFLFLSKLASYLCLYFADILNSRVFLKFSWLNLLDLLNFLPSCYNNHSRFRDFIFNLGLHSVISVNIINNPNDFTHYLSVIHNTSRKYNIKQKANGLLHSLDFYLLA